MWPWDRPNSCRSYYPKAVSRLQGGRGLTISMAFKPLPRGDSLIFFGKPLDLNLSRLMDLVWYPSFTPLWQVAMRKPS